MKRLLIAATLLTSPMSVPIANATPGGLNAQGCHTDRKGGTGYHCHRSQGTSAAPRAARSSGGSVYYANCAAARAAGAAPVMRGDPGYSSKLDRDNDGVGCE